MAYRPTERTEAKRVETRERIVRAASELVARGGYREAQVAAGARRAGVAAGGVGDAGERAPRPNPAGSPSPRRALQGRRLAWALLAEPVDPAVEAERLE